MRPRGAEEYPASSAVLEDEGDSDAQTELKEPLNCFNRPIDQWSIKGSMQWGLKCVEMRLFYLCSTE